MLCKAVIVLGVLAVLGYSVVHSKAVAEDEHAKLTKRSAPVASPDDVTAERPAMRKRSIRLKRSANIVKRSTCAPKYAALPASTMCDYDVDPTATDLGVSMEQIVEIVNLHNQYRSAAKPSPGNMQRLYWDPDIAEIAQHYAATCRRLQHDKNNQRWFPGYGINMGQNLGVGYSSWTAVINAWHNEEKDFEYGQDTSAMVGHFTQMMNAKSSSIGCGYAKCSWGKNYVCNYAYGQTPERKRRPYDDGAQCADCPDSCVDGLCDCSGWICMNNGILDPNTCQCSCPDLYSGSACHRFACPNKDPPQCAGYDALGTQESMCALAQVYTECPIYCGYCDEKCPGMSNSQCKNGGTLDYDTCKCKCASGYSGDVCDVLEVSCKTDESFCGQYAIWCGFDDFVDTSCPHTCGKC